MPFNLNRDFQLRRLEESRRKKKEAISGSPQREVIDAVYTTTKEQGLVCQECGGKLYIFSPAMRPYCEAHQHLATEIIDAALDTGCTVIPEPGASAVLRVVDLAVEIQEWVMGQYRTGILRRWQEQIKGLRDSAQIERATGKLEAEYRKAQQQHPKWADYLTACRESDIASGLSDPRCPQCAVKVAGDPVVVFGLYHAYLQEHGGAARLCPSHSLSLRAARGDNCPVCGGTAFWMGPGGRLCSRCHPAPDADMSGVAVYEVNRQSKEDDRV